MPFLVSSCAKLLYGDAQEVIEGRSLPEAKAADADLRKSMEGDILALNVRPQAATRYFTLTQFPAEHRTSSPITSIREWCVAH